MSDNLEDLNRVGGSTANALREAGFTRYVGIAAANPSELSQKVDTSLGETTAEKIIASARKKANIGNFKTGSEMKEKTDREKDDVLIFPTTKSREDLDGTEKELRELLDGGITTGSITEVSGSPNSGKTQTLHQLSVNCQLPKSVGGLNGRLFYIDTENTYSSDRIIQMVKGLDDDVKEETMKERGIEPADSDNEESMKALIKEILDGIMVSRTQSSNHQMLMVEKARKEAGKHNDDLGEEERPYRMMIIDSLTSHFRAEYIGRGELADRQQKLNTHLTESRNFAEAENAVVAYSNQVAANVQGTYGRAQTIGGNIVGHKKDFELRIRESKNNKIIYKLKKAPDLEEGETTAKIKTEGIKPA